MIRRHCDDLVRYPILPKVIRLESEVVRREMLQIRHSSLYSPRDFDISPYFQIVKPTLVESFNYKFMDWALRSRPQMMYQSTSRPSTPANRPIIVGVQV